ncbi:hypothetical protein [Shewanella gaetbuli]|uniref:Uncharacterized protein n=1 Tax=Shewanella gaetbuli TaxID=220752 RepID=A0A9X2CI06_9GAMM|nr:hypothetical protein [Shewanella gaetbuli]MCL1144078.1 hypothetical protein [Shewanella gaetbuli]
MITKHNFKILVIVSILAILAYSLYDNNNNKPTLNISVVSSDYKPEKSALTTSKVSNTSHQKPEYISQPIKQNSINNDMSEEISPFTMLSKYTGTISLDLHSYDDIQVSTKVNIITPNAEYKSVIDDIYFDYDLEQLIVSFHGDNNEGLLVYHPQDGSSFLTFNSQQLSFESILDNNGVGEFVNIAELEKDGIITPPNYENDTVYVDNTKR